MYLHKLITFPCQNKVKVYLSTKCAKHPHCERVTVDSLFLHRELLQFCSCRSAGGSIYSYPRVLSRVPTLEPWLAPQPCTDVATAFCLRSVSHFLIKTFLHGRKCHKLCSHHVSWAPPVSKRDVLARGSSVLCLQAVPESPSPEESSAQSSSRSSSSSSIGTHLEKSNNEHLAACCTTSDQQRGVLSNDSFIPGFYFCFARHYEASFVIFLPVFCCCL